MENLKSHIENEVLVEDTASARFEHNYIRLRQKEKRIYSDEEVANLPVVSIGHPHYAEWKSRQQSIKRLFNYLEKKERPLNILEIGCGNGWLSHQLSKLKRSQVTGSDINHTELEQASRVFVNKPNLKFIYYDILSGAGNDRRFDIIVFAASIQYFHSLSDTIRHGFQILNPGGEIHILDSPFYKPGEITFAERRTEEYYRKLGFPEMTDHYFHHSSEVLDIFYPRILYKPFPFPSFLKLYNNPFPWICIKNQGA
jgi:ubiquinone/menaquinone biosynthesis C-methylase UbiE